MTDERQGERLWPALDGLPRGSGVIIRHYSLAPADRRALIDAIRMRAAQSGLVTLVAGSARMATEMRVQGYHARSAHRGPDRLIRTTAVHNPAELRLAERSGADLAFVSPVFGTDSHPGAKPLGRARFGALIRSSRIPVIALGGMNDRRAQSLAAMGIYGWAAIGALTPD